VLRPPRPQQPSQRWAAFVRNHAQAVLACEFCVAMMATFRVVYIFVILEIGTRRIAPWNVTAHPSAGWRSQRFRWRSRAKLRIGS